MNKIIFILLGLAILLGGLAIWAFFNGLNQLAGR